MTIIFSVGGQLHQSAKHLRGKHVVALYWTDDGTHAVVVEVDTVGALPMRGVQPIKLPLRNLTVAVVAMPKS